MCSLRKTLSGSFAYSLGKYWPTWPSTQLACKDSRVPKDKLIGEDLWLSALMFIPGLETMMSVCLLLFRYVYFYFFLWTLVLYKHSSILINKKLVGLQTKKKICELMNCFLPYLQAIFFLQKQTRNIHKISFISRDNQFYLRKRPNTPMTRRIKVFQHKL